MVQQPLSEQVVYLQTLRVSNSGQQIVLPSQLPTARMCAWYGRDWISGTAI